VSNRIFEAFRGDAFSGRTFEHGHTYTGNPLASAAACAAMELLMEYDIPASQQKKSAYLAEQLAAFYRYDITGDVRTLGSVGAIELVADRASKHPLPEEKRIPFFIGRNALNYGLLLRPLGDVIYFMLPYITTEDQLDEIMVLTHKAFQDTIDEHLTRS
jgi:adenosylmethionine-8-amino-7-oxononanoate aminotransferase